VRVIVLLVPCYFFHKPLSACVPNLNSDSEELTLLQITELYSFTNGNRSHASL
jgi:hypothetical protein